MGSPSQYNGQPPRNRSPTSPDGPLERAVRDHLFADLPLLLNPSRQSQVERGRSIVGYAQNQHLAGVDAAIADDPNLRVAINTAYLITPDVLVGIPGTPTLTVHP